MLLVDSYPNKTIITIDILTKPKISNKFLRHVQIKNITLGIIKRKLLTNRQTTDIYTFKDIYLYEKSITVYLNILKLCKNLAFKIFFIHLTNSICNMMDPLEVAMLDVYKGLGDKIFCMFLTNYAQTNSFTSFLEPLNHTSMVLKMTPLWE